MNQSLPFLHGWSLEITLTIPSSYDFKQFSELMIFDVFLKLFFMIFCRLSREKRYSECIFDINCQVLILFTQKI